MCNLSLGIEERAMEKARKENTTEIMKYRDKDTPVCVIESGTLPDENVIFGTLENISQKDIKTPAILIIGEVVKLYKFHI